ncbi:LysM peptidoglycan-binding domain-containing protein [Echinimonas agarilytica]|uniref:LysM peptidoglycan-binding domain-containing protein n=1 Tax=Echinimonas agarilytica TaxID=1215918 RepID=A0AA41W381_9GAMM|nr:LysM peptidoglycan-binding domain-containing protein [Echinimonas agarilytica]MCM2678062.1 LysM peptidoglycan-binding domain-containing protein [Echinimonas agarilytica]
MSRKLSLALGAILSFFIATTAATELKVRADYPEVYIVKKGDTLWDISELFLSTPWLWPQLWQANPQVDNPHLIYPGDRLYLTFVNGQPRLSKKKVIKMSPQVRAEPHLSAIPAIPLSVIEPFLKREQVVSQAQYNAMPYVLGTNDGNTRAYQGQLMYGKGEIENAGRYGIYHAEQELRRFGEPEVLGLRMSLIAVADASQHDDLIALTIIKGNQEIRQGDRIMPLLPAENLSVSYMPQAPVTPIAGHVIATHDNLEYFAAHDVVVIDRGREDGVKPGHTMAVYQLGKGVVDDENAPVYVEDTSHYEKLEGMVINVGKLELPSVPRGHVMVFRTFDKVSYALVMRAQQQLQVFDEVRTAQ